MQNTLIRKMVFCNKAARPVAPYNQAIVVDRTVYVSGVLGLDVETNVLVTGGVENEAKQALNSLKEILETAGSCLNNVVKTTILLQNMEDFPKVNDIYKEFFEKDFPARMCYQVAKLPLSALIELDAIALTGNVTSEYLTNRLSLNSDNLKCKI